MFAADVAHNGIALAQLDISINVIWKLMIIQKCFIIFENLNFKIINQILHLGNPVRGWTWCQTSTTCQRLVQVHKHNTYLQTLCQCMQGGAGSAGPTDKNWQWINFSTTHCLDKYDKDLPHECPNKQAEGVSSYK